MLYTTLSLAPIFAFFSLYILNGLYTNKFHWKNNILRHHSVLFKFTWGYISTYPFEYAAVSPNGFWYLQWALVAMQLSSAAACNIVNGWAQVNSDRTSIKEIMHFNWSFETNSTNILYTLDTCSLTKK